MDVDGLQWVPDPQVTFTNKWSWLPMDLHGPLKYRQAMVRPGWPDKGFSGIFEREFSGYDSRSRDLGLRTERPVPFQASGLAQPDKGPSGIFPESLGILLKRLLVMIRG